MCPPKGLEDTPFKIQTLSGDPVLFRFCFPKNVYVKTISIQSCLQPRVHE